MSDCEPFSYEWERELLRMRKSDLVNYIRDILRDRQAATGEKSSVVGNAAQMREALELASRVIHGAIAADILKGDDAQAAFFACRSALSAPPRNCDRFETWDEAYLYWAVVEQDVDDALVEDSGDTPRERAEELWPYFGTDQNQEFLDWFVAPAELDAKGGAK